VTYKRFESLEKKAIRLLSFVAAYYKDGFYMLLHVTSKPLMEQPIQPHNASEPESEVIVDTKADLDLTLLDPDHTGAFLSRMVMLLYTEMNNLNEGDPQAKREAVSLISETVRLFIMIAVRVPQLSSHVSSVRFNLISVLTRLIRGQEITSLQEQAELIRSLLFSQHQPNTDLHLSSAKIGQD